MTIPASFANVSIKSGVTTSPAIGVQAGLNYLDVAMSRENWPAAGVDVELLASFDGSATYETVAGPLHIDAYVPTAKQPLPVDAKIGFSWSDRVPDHAKGRATSTSPTFTSTIKITGG